MTIQTFTAGQKLTALQMNTLQASDFNFTRNVRTDLAYTFVLADKGKLVESTNAGSATFTIPTNADAAFTIGDRIDVLLASDGSVTIAGASGVTVYAEGDLTTISSKWTKVTLIKRATNSWVITGGGLSVQTVELDNLSVTTGKLANSAVTSEKIADGAIVNADINSSAAIALSKLASGTSAQVVIANSSGVPTYTTLTGDVTVSNTGVTTIQPNSVALGTDTTGDYVSSLVAGTGITLTNNSGEGATPTVAIGQAVGTSSSVQFAAVTAPLVGNASTASALQTARTISLTGDVSGSVSFDGSASVAISTTIQPNSVALGTDTTGNYMSGITAGTGLTVTHTPGEGSTATVALSGYSFTTSSVAYTLALTDNNNLVESTATSDIDITVPPSASVAFLDGTQITIFRRGTGRVRILEGSGVTILATPGKYLRAQYSGATLVRRSENVWFLFGDLSST